LETEERNLFSAAYKNLIGGRRTAYRALTAIEQKEESKSTKNVQLVKDYKKKVEAEIEKICDEVVQVIDTTLLPKAAKLEGKVFYMKMKGDYYRYFAECTSGDKLKDVTTKAKTAYEEANKMAEELPSTDSTKLGLALNFSVFHYEILNSPADAIKLAKTSFDSAVSQLEGLDDDQYKDSASILQLLRDNLTLWQNENNNENES
jgi:14-3-3 protein epsilon